MRHPPGRWLAALALASAAVLPSGCGPSTAETVSARTGPACRGPAALQPVFKESRAGPAVALRLTQDARVVSLSKGAVACLFPGYHEYRSYGAYGSPYLTVPLHMSVQFTHETGASLSGAGVKLGRGGGWSVTFADNHVGGEGWIGGGSYDMEGFSSDAHLFFIRGGLRMAYLEARPLYGFMAVGFSLDWVSSAKFDTLVTVNIGDEDDWAPVGFYFRFGGGLALGRALCYAEFATTAAWVSDADFITHGWFRTWGGSLGAGFVF